MKVVLSMLFALLFAFSAAACAPEGEIGSLVKDWPDGPRFENAARVEMEVAGEKIYASLADNAAAKEFADRLAKGETTLAFSDFAGAEKIAYPSPTLTASDSEGCDPEIGDMTIYKPWGNIAIFYRDSSGYSSDLVHLGKIEGDGIKIFAAQSGDFIVTLRLAGG